MGNKETQFWYGDAVIDGYSSDEGIEIWRRETTAFFSNLQKDKYRSVWSIMQPTVDEHQTPELSDDDAYALTHEDRMHDVSNWTFGVNHLPAFDAEVEDKLSLWHRKNAISNFFDDLLAHGATEQTIMSEDLWHVTAADENKIADKEEQARLKLDHIHVDIKLAERFIVQNETGADFVDVGLVENKEAGDLCVGSVVDDEWVVL